MRFHIQRRRRPPAVIIVALIDILIVMLIFLMVTTTFKQQPALKLALPESSQAVKTGAHEEVPLIVSIDPQGNLRFGPEAKPMTMERFEDELIGRSATNAELKLALSADKAAPFGQIVKVMDAAKKANIKAVSAFTRETGKQ